MQRGGAILGPVSVQSSLRAEEQLNHWQLTLDSDSKQVEIKSYSVIVRDPDFAGARPWSWLLVGDPGF